MHVFDRFTINYSQSLGADLSLELILTESVRMSEEGRVELPCVESLPSGVDRVHFELMQTRLLLHLIEPRAAAAEPEGDVLVSRPHGEGSVNVEADGAPARLQQPPPFESRAASTPWRPPALRAARLLEANLAERGELVRDRAQRDDEDWQREM